MELERLQKNWTNLGSRDPLWAILSDPHTENGGWDVDSFLRTGVDFCNYLARHFAGLQVDVTRGRALDFGCGYGRLTQGLAAWFDQVVGVDIAPSMIRGAREFDRTRGQCTFVVNQTPDLRQFADASFDFVLTTLVLQHMRPQYSLGYLREFLRVLRPGGHLFFQLPTEPLAPRIDDTRSTSPAPLPFVDLRGSIAVHPGFHAIYCAGWQWYRLHLDNHGSQVWRAGEGPAKVQVAARWHHLEGTPGGPMVCADLPHDLGPGQSLRMLMPMRAPADPCKAVLQFLPVQGRRWLESVELAAARLVADVAVCAPEVVQANLRVTDPRPVTAPARVDGSGTEDEAEIEVYHVPTAEVVDVVHEAGGEVIDVAEDVWAGPDFLSAHYTVRKN
jgi:SAM-dependent methyltransferase